MLEGGIRVMAAIVYQTDKRQGLFMRMNQSHIGTKRGSNLEQFVNVLEKLILKQVKLYQLEAIIQRNIE